MSKNIRITLLIAALCCLADAFGAKVDTVAIATSHIPGAAKAVVITPESSTTAKFPTVYLLNGFGGDHKSWVTIRPDLPRLADLYGMVLVMPDGRDSWYFDVPADPSLQMESFIVKDLVPYIDDRYPTIPLASKRAITGLSMGGHGALYLAIRHPEIWMAAGSTSGGVDIRPFPDRWRLPERLGDYSRNKDVWDRNTVINMTDSIKPGMRIIFDCGSEDFFAQVNRDLHEKLTEKKIPHEYISRPGTHNLAYWANSILYHLLFFNETFSRR